MPTAQNLSFALLIPTIIGIACLLILPLFRLGSGAPVPRSFLQRSPQQYLNTVALSATYTREGHAVDKYLASYNSRPSFTAFNYTTAQHVVSSELYPFETVKALRLQPAHSATHNKDHNFTTTRTRSLRGPKSLEYLASP